MNLNIRYIEITEFVTHLAEKASTTGYRHTILNPTVTSTSHSEAATAGAVKVVADIANTKAPASHTHTIGQVTGLQIELDSKIPKSSINQPSGVVGIGADGVPQIAPKRTKLFEVNLAQNPSAEVSINNLTNYKYFLLVITNISNSNPSSNTLYVTVNNLTLSTDYNGYIITSVINSADRASIARIESARPDYPLNATVEINYSGKIIRGIGLFSSAPAGQYTTDTILKNATVQSIDSIQVKYTLAGSMNVGIIELWGVPK